MPAATVVWLNEYLNHSRLQGMLVHYLISREKQWGIVVVPEQCVQVRARRFRVLILRSSPEVCLRAAIVTKPPFLCVEILSPSDRLTEMQQRIDDYLSFGVSYVWVIDPQTRRAYLYTSDAIRDVRDGVLTANSPDIRVVLDEL